MNAYNKLSSYAQAMSTMVTMSQIDTKKFGNDIVSHRLFVNRYLTNRYQHSGITWIINTDEFMKNLPTKTNEKGKTVVDKDATSDKAMNIYFDQLFLNSKLESAVTYTRDLLKNQTLVATDAFNDLYTSAM